MKEEEIENNVLDRSQKVERAVRYYRAIESTERSLETQKNRLTAELKGLTKEQIREYARRTGA